MTKIAAAILLGTFSWPLQARAAPTECAENFPQCSLTSARITQAGGRLTNVDETWDVAWADGFVMGVAMTGNLKYWCLPARFSGVQLAAVVSKYVQANPDKWNEAPVQIAGNAFAQSFPCRKSGTP
jgi:hypothetical protein